MTALPIGYERRYLPHGRSAHAMDTDHDLYRGAARCGTVPLWFQPAGWLGTGSQQEYERAAALPLCRRCARLLGLDPSPAQPPGSVPS